MARTILSNSSSNLNLSRRQLALMQDVLILGNEISDYLEDFGVQQPLPKQLEKLVKRWSYLMIKLAKVLV